MEKSSSRKCFVFVKEYGRFKRSTQRLMIVKIQTTVTRNSFCRAGFARYIKITTVAAFAGNLLLSPLTALAAPGQDGKLSKPAGDKPAKQSPVEDVAFFEKKYQRKIVGVKPINDYSDPDQFYTAIATQLGIPDIARQAAFTKYGWKEADGKITQIMVKGGPTFDGGPGKWDVMFFRAELDPETKKPIPASIETKMVQIDYDGHITFLEAK